MTAADSTTAKLLASERLPPMSLGLITQISKLSFGEQNEACGIKSRSVAEIMKKASFFPLKTNDYFYWRNHKKKRRRGHLTMYQAGPKWLAAQQPQEKTNSAHINTHRRCCLNSQTSYPQLKLLKNGRLKWRHPKSCQTIFSSFYFLNYLH